MSISNFTRLRCGANGKPRYVCSWTGFGFESYAQAIMAANRMGGRKYHNKQYDGGLVFQVYESDLERINRQLRNSAHLS